MKNFNQPKIILTVILLVALVLRLLYAQTRTYFNDCDELITVSTATGISIRGELPTGKVFKTAIYTQPSMSDRLRQCARSGDNGNSYFFNLVMSFWVDIFGSGEMVFRFFAAFCDCISMLLLFSIGKLLRMDEKQVLLSCLLLAISAIFLMFCGGFVRTYGFTTMLVLGMVFYFIKCYQDPSKKQNFAILFLLFCAVFLGHFLTYYLFGVLLVFAFVRRKDHRQFNRRILVVYGLFALAVITFFILNKEGFAAMQKRGASIASLASEDEFGRLNFKNIVYAVSGYLLAFYNSISETMAFSNVLGLKTIPFASFLLLLLSPVILFLIQGKKIMREDRYLLPWLMVLIANGSAIGMMFASKQFTSLDSRYTIFSVPFFYLLVTQLDFRKISHSVFLGLYFVVISISTIGTVNGFYMSPIKLKVSELKSGKFYVSDLPTIRTYFQKKTATLDPNKLLCFKTRNDYVFFCLITNFTATNYCIIDPRFPNGVSSSGGFKIEFEYFVDC